MAISEERGFLLPAEIVRLATGDANAAAAVLTVDNLPPQGILYVGNPII